MRLKQCIRRVLWWPTGQRRDVPMTPSSGQVGGDTLLAVARDPIYGTAIRAVARARRRP